MSEPAPGGPNLCGYRQPDKSFHHLDGSYVFKLVPKTTVRVTMSVPNVVVTPHGNGTWTMVYDEGFFVNVNDMEFFAFHAYKPKKGTQLSNIKPENYISYCHRTLVGWYRVGDKWGCWRGKQVEKAYPQIVFKSGAPPKHQVDFAVVSPVKRNENELDKLFNPNYALIETINSDPTSLWAAEVHRPFLSKSNRQMLALTGGLQFAKKLRAVHAVPSSPVSAEEESLYTSLLSATEESVITASTSNTLHHDASTDSSLTATATPASSADAQFPGVKTNEQGEKLCEYGLPCALDWRNRFGHNWISPVRNQGSCGSCYAMALATVAESRIRIARKDPKRYRLSPQHAVSCSVYNQGCDGGFPFLVGKHYEHFGVVSEKCFPYAASDSQCSRACKAAVEHPISNTRYVGGFYGNTSEEAMMRELMDGPITVAFEAPHGLFSYRGGIFTGPKPASEDQQVPGVAMFQHTNHAVVAVGWGHSLVNGQRVKYWIFLNSWGKTWGEQGYFRVVRGRDECGVESMSVAVTAKV